MINIKKLDQRTWLMPCPRYKLWEGTGGKGVRVTESLTD